MLWCLELIKCPGLNFTLKSDYLASHSIMSALETLTDINTPRHEGRWQRQ